MPTETGEVQSLRGAQLSSGRSTPCQCLKGGVQI